MSYSFTVFGEDWGRHPSSTQHIFKQIMKEHDVHWVNSIGLRSPKLSMKDVTRLLEKGKQSLEKTTPRSIEEEPQIYSPRILPFHGSKFGQFVNRRLFETPARNTSVLWTSLPTSQYLHENVDADCTIYYCGDDFEALEGVDHDMVAKHEQKLAEQADIIFVINKELAKKFPEAKTHILDHGVDIELFSAPCPRPLDLPQWNKIAGFYGSIQTWMDVELIKETATMCPDWKFVLIGKAHIDLSELESYPNICLLGAKEHHELPGYVQHWDISLLPFKQNRQIEACSPLKLKEYMASGTPIVSTKFPAVEIYDDLIEIAETPKAFATAIKHLHAEGTEQRYDRQYAQQAAMRKHSWEARYQYIQGVIEECLGLSKRGGKRLT